MASPPPSPACRAMLSLRLPSVRALSGLWRLVLPAPGPMPPALLLLVVVVLAGPARSAPLATPLPLQQQLQAEFRKEGEVRWRPVTLPDSWRRRDEPPRGTGLYRIRLPASTSAGADLALWIEHIPSRHRIRLNGHLLSDRAGQERRDGARGQDPSARSRRALQDASEKAGR